MKWIDRRALLRLGGLGLCGSGAAGYASGPGRRVVVEKVECPLRPKHAHLDGLRVVVLSDFHHDDFPRDGVVTDAVNAANAFRPHLTLLVGDYVSSDPSAMERLVPLLSPLRAEMGVFAVMGNHDHDTDPEAIEQALVAGGLTVLRDRSRRFAHGGGAFSLAGLESHWTGVPDWKAMQEALPAGEPIILGWHEPDTFVETQEDPRLALQVSGHTHGGQICAPWGPLVLPRYGQRYPRGLYTEGGSALYVTRGVGVLDYPFRFFCPAEASCLTLKA